MSTTSLELTAEALRHTESVAVRIADWIAAAMLRLQWVGRFVVAGPAPAVPQTAAELLRLADEYERTQPGYAADLRAAALRAR